MRLLHQNIGVEASRAQSECGGNVYAHDDILARRPTIQNARSTPGINGRLKGEPGLATQLPHQIVVYPNRVKLLGNALACSLATPIFLLVCLLLASGTDAPPPELGILGIILTVIEIIGRLLIGAVMLACALVLAEVVVCIIYRILVRKPSVIIDSDGIIDQCSLIAGGLGLIRWDEIESIALYAYRKKSEVLLCDDT